MAGVPELLEDLGLLRPGGPPLGPGDPLLTALTEVERAVATRLAAGPATVDELVAATGTRGATILGALTSLELRGFVLEAYGRYRPAGALASRSPREPVRVPGARSRRSRCAA